MPLPVIPAHALTSADDLLRLYQRTERLWAEHLGASEQLDVGVAVTSPDLSNVHDANRMLEARLPPGQAPAEAYDEVRRHFDRLGTRCRAWQLSAGGGTAETALSQYLAGRGYERKSEDVMALTAPLDLGEKTQPATPRAHERKTPVGIVVLPTRAAFRQARELAVEASTPHEEPTLAEAHLLHLDDPHCDALLALRDGNAVGRITVFAVGEIGRIDQVYVRQSARGEGIGRLLMGRALEICARSIFKHVLLSVDPTNAAAIGLYQHFGFRRVGERVNWQLSGSMADARP